MEEKDANQQINNVLLKIRRLAENNDKNIKQMIPHLLVRSDNKNPELLSLLRKYEKLIMENHVLTEDEYTKISYLELTYPEPKQSEGVFDLFFDSPSEVANTNSRNRYTGVFMISLDNYAEKNCDKDEHIQQLVQYVKEKQSTIRFVFLLPPEASFLDELEKILQECLTIEKVDMSLPTQGEVEKFLVGVLDKQGIYISSNGYEDIRLFAKKVIESPEYNGFDTLEVISKKILFILYSDGYDEKIIDDTSIQEILSKVYVSENSIDINKMRKIGFC